MNGLIIKLPTSITDTTLPILYPDAIMSKGSLFLFDPSNSNGGSSTIFTNNGSVPNLAWKTAQSMIGSGDSNTLAGIINVNVSASTALLELTGKKGVHMIYSKVNGTSTTSWQCLLPTLIKQYIFNSWTTKKLYVSVWGQITRTCDTNVSGFMLLGASTSAYKTMFERDNNLPVTGVSLLGTRMNPTPANALGSFIRTVGVNGSVGTTPATINNFSAYAKLGAGGIYGGFEANKAASMIIYRIYIEDLDVSGRTYAEVDALDKSLYDSAFSADGKYYGDTFTAPSVLP